MRPGWSWFQLHPGRIVLENKESLMPEEAGQTGDSFSYEPRRGYPRTCFSLSQRSSG
jgi:hypothetical protein